MGDVADFMLDGVLCEWCGSYIEGSGGYPQLCADCFDEATPARRREYRFRHEGCSDDCRVCHPRKRYAR